MRVFLLLAILLASFTTYAQTKLTGNVRDTSGKQWLPNAVVALISQKDSQLVRFTRSNENGQFVLDRLRPGSYILLASYPKFADFSDIIQLKEGENNFGTISLTLRSKLMEAVVVRSAGAVRIKGDTTEFVADSFVVRDGATVEELLRKFPGFQVNSKGEITAQGRKVEKVLVDGEEFFGDDPTIATQNISAKAVDKVQVFDNKSEQQNVTGITSGNEGKTINIKLKEDSKKGAFGRAHAGTDFDRFIDAKVMYNRFRGKRKAAVYGTRSTISTGSLNWSDQRSLGIEPDWEYDEIGDFYIGFNNDDGFNDWSLRGLPSSYTAGALFSDKWNEEKQAINTNYRYNRMGVTNNRSALQQNITKEGISYRNQRGFDDNFNQQHNMTLRYDWKLDSLTSFRFTTTGTRRINNQESFTNSEFIGFSGDTLNTSRQDRAQNSERTQWENSLVWKQLFKKKNRQFTTTLRFGLIDDDQNGVNVTRLRFYQNGINARDSIVDQQRVFDGHSKTYGVKTLFIEPLSAKLNLITDFSYNRNNAYSYRNTFNKTPDGKYGLKDTLFSNNFDMNASIVSGSALLRYTTSKLRFTAGAGLASTTLSLFNRDSAITSRFRFVNFIPQVNIGYTFKPQEGINLNYRGSTLQPSINQLQPVRDNNDPLNILVGNPNLKVGFNHAVNLTYNRNRTLKQEYIWIGLFTNFQQNAVTYTNIIDPQSGKQTTTPVNVNGNYNWNLWSNFNKGFGEKKWSYFMEVEANGSRNVNFINGQQNISYNNTVTFRPGTYFEIENKHMIRLSPRIGYNWTTNTLQTFKNNFLIYGGSVDAMYMLPGKLRLESDVNYDVQGVIPAFGTRISIIRWNARLSKTFFKKNNGTIMLVANDILNQNIGFTRNLNTNFISENRFDRIARYFLLKFEWSFNQSPGAK